MVGDATALPFAYGSFDIAGCMRVLHHARRPELVVSELARVTRPGGRILLIDQLGFVDPVVSAETDRFEKARDPSHTRLLPDQDIRSLLDVNDLDVLTNEIAPEQRDLERYLDLVGLAGEERRRVSGMAPGAVYEVEIGWYVARKRGGLGVARGDGHRAGSRRERDPERRPKPFRANPSVARKRAFQDLAARGRAANIGAASRSVSVAVHVPGRRTQRASPQRNLRARRYSSPSLRATVRRSIPEGVQRSRTTWPGRRAGRRSTRASGRGCGARHSTV